MKQLLRAIPLVFLPILLSTCEPAFENPVDSGSTLYQGFPSVQGVTGVVPYSPADGGTLAWPELACVKSPDADLYQVQVAASAAGLASAAAVEVATNAIHADSIDLTVDSTYYWRVRARDKASGTWGDWSASASFKTGSAITGVGPADGGSSDSLVLDWADVADASGYEVQVAESATAVPSAQAASAAASGYTIVGTHDSGSAIYWRVRPVRSDGIKGFWSQVMSFTAAWTPSVAGITPVDSGATNDTTPLLDWADGSDVSAYDVQYATSAAGIAGAAANRVTSSEYAISTALANGTSVYWRLRPINANGIVAAWSATWSFQVDITAVALSAPTNAASTSDTTPTLSWQANEIAARYHVALAGDAAFTSPLMDTTSITATTYTLSGQGQEVLADGQTYYWKVSCIDANGVEGTSSGAWSFTVDLPVPTTPSPSTGATTDDTTPLLDWADTTGASGYRVQVGSDSTFAASVADDDTLTASQCQVSPALANATTYYWRVMMKNADGVWSDWSETWSFTIQITTGITIVADPQNPIPITFSGQHTTLWSGSTMTITATTSDTVDAYQWYLNGTAIPGATSAAVTVGSGLKVGNHRLTLVVTKGTSYATGCLDFAITPLPHEPINATLAYRGLSLRVVPIIAAGSTESYKGMTLTAYALSDAEVTQGDYRAVRGSNPASGYGAGTNYPVYYATWYDGVRFCNALSTSCGLQPVYDESTWAADFTKNGFYLPTDAQWEYAAGGPNHYGWSLSDTFTASDYVFNFNYGSSTAPVKSKAANGFGLYDMSGNVWEWCHDWHGGGWPYTGQTDPNGPTSGTYRMIRSGGWSNTDPALLRSDLRNGSLPADGYSNIGFRVAVGGHGLW